MRRGPSERPCSLWLALRAEAPSSHCAAGPPCGFTHHGISVTWLSLTGLCAGGGSWPWASIPASQHPNIPSIPPPAHPNCCLAVPYADKGLSSSAPQQETAKDVRAGFAGKLAESGLAISCGLHQQPRTRAQQLSASRGHTERSSCCTAPWPLARGLNKTACQLREARYGFSRRPSFYSSRKAQHPRTP